MAGGDRFLEKDLFNLIDSSKKDVDEFRMILPKNDSKERCHPQWTTSNHEENIIAMVKLIITCNSSTGKASEFTDQFIAMDEYRTFSNKEGTSIAKYAIQLYQLDRKILQLERS